MENIQSILDKLTAQSDIRTTVFDIEIQKLQNRTLILSGRLLDGSQLETLAHHFADWKLDAALIQILSRSDLRSMHVATNLTGLYAQPTFSMPLSSELRYGTELEILDEQEQWVFTRQKDGYLGWAYKAYLADGPAATATHRVLAPSCELRAEPDTAGEVVTRVVSGTAVAVEERVGGWAKISANKTGWIETSFLRALDGLPKSMNEKRKTLLEDSRRMIGVPYLWGGVSGNGIDCSGLARLLHEWVGMDIPRDADMQHAAAKPVEPPFEIGDLLFFGEGGSARHITHVGVSLGGWKMIHSSRGRNGVYIDDVQERESLREIYKGAGSFLRF